MINITTENVTKIPKQLRLGLTESYIQALGAMGIGEKFTYTRTALNILRTEFVLSGKGQVYIEAVDAWSKILHNEVIKCEARGETPMEGILLKKICNALDFLSPFVFEGYGEINSGTFSVKKIEKVEVKDNVT